MKTILLPSDLSIQSLYPVHNIIKEANGESVNIMVVHFLSLSTSISDLLTLKEPYGQIPSHFTEAFQSLRNKYRVAINKLEFRFVYCNTTRYLNNFIEGNNINEVYLLDNYRYGTPLNNSVECKNFFSKCKVKVNHLSLRPEAQSEYQILSSLLFKQDMANNANMKVSEAAVSY